jgi:hypothetical protein
MNKLVELGRVSEDTNGMLFPPTEFGEEPCNPISDPCD